MDSIRIYSLNHLPHSMQNILREGQQEAAKVVEFLQRPSPGRTRLQDLLAEPGYPSESNEGPVCVAFSIGADGGACVLGSGGLHQRARQPANPEIRYPYKEKRFYPLLWPAQAVAVSEKRIILPVGRGRKSVVLFRPEGFPDEGGAVKIVWNGIGYELHVVHTPEESARQEGHRATADLGQIHQAAVTTDDVRALIVSGRGIRSEKRRHNRVMGKIQKLKARCKRGSKRIKRLAAAQRRGRKQNQWMSQWEYGKDIDYLSHKSSLAGMTCFAGTERGTSSRCPSCGHRHKPKGRVWRCKACGFVGHRDLVGSVNIHEISFGEKAQFPERRSTTYLRPGHTNPWQASHEDPAVGSSRCPDAGHRLGTV